MPRIRKLYKHKTRGNFMSQQKAQSIQHLNIVSSIFHLSQEKSDD